MGNSQSDNPEEEKTRHVKLKIDVDILERNQGTRVRFMLDNDPQPAKEKQDELMKKMKQVTADLKSLRERDQKPCD